MSKQSLETRLIHAGETRVMGSVVTPIFQTAMFEYSGETEARDLKYVRYSNSPNHDALHQKLASLAEAEAGLVTASGMAAISTTLLTCLEPGGHLLVQDQLYGGTRSFIEGLPELGMSYTWIDGDRPETWAAALTDQTRAIYAEALTNPTMRTPDHRAVVAFAKQHELVSIIDNTFLSPVNFRPIALGYDVVVHSCTKYLNGHSDLGAGAVMGSAEMIERILAKVRNYGSHLDPHACFLLQRGLKTLAVRLRHQNETAMALAVFLRDHPKVEAVYYPGLPEDPYHERAKDLFDGFGGMISFVPRGDVDSLTRGLTIPIHTFSLGGVETLIIEPAKTSHLLLPREERLRLGIGDDMLRVSVGLESADDLISDFASALHGI